MDLLAREIDRAIRDPKIAQDFANLLIEPKGGTPEEFSAAIQREVPRWIEVGKKAGVKLD